MFQLIGTAIKEYETEKDPRGECNKKNIRAKSLNGHAWYKTPVAFNLERLWLLWDASRGDLKHLCNNLLGESSPPKVAEQTFCHFVGHTGKDEVLCLCFFFLVRFSELILQERTH